MTTDDRCACGHPEFHHERPRCATRTGAICDCEGFRPVAAPDNLDAKLSVRPSATSDGLPADGVRCADVKRQPHGEIAVLDRNGYSLYVCADCGQDINSLLPCPAKRSTQPNPPSFDSMLNDPTQQLDTEGEVAAVVFAVPVPVGDRDDATLTDEEAAWQKWSTRWAGAEFTRNGHAAFLAGFEAGRGDRAAAWDEGNATGDCGCAHDTCCRWQEAVNPYRTGEDA